MKKTDSGLFLGLKIPHFYLKVGNKKEAVAPFCQFRFFLKNAMVFSHACLAAASSNRGVVLL